MGGGEREIVLEKCLSFASADEWRGVLPICNVVVSCNLHLYLLNVFLKILHQNLKLYVVLVRARVCVSFHTLVE